MRVRLLKSANIQHNPGDIVEVSPERASFLISVGSALPVEENRETPEETVKKSVKKATKK